jgi:hypothetical protein
MDYSTRTSILLYYYTKAELVDYEKVYGHCNASGVDDSHKQLGIWVSTQRTEHKKGTLTEERFTQLNDLGFEFEWLIGGTNRSNQKTHLCLDNTHTHAKTVSGKKTGLCLSKSHISH